MRTAAQTTPGSGRRARTLMFDDESWEFLTAVANELDRDRSWIIERVLTKLEDRVRITDGFDPQSLEEEGLR